jgi:CHAD domain-containing protein/alkylhydroperoxidase family enzyme
MRAPDGSTLNIFATLAQHPALLKRWMVFAAHVMSKNTLTPRDRELLILRVGVRCASPYEFAQHHVIAQRCDITVDEIEHVQDGPDHPSWSPYDAALLRAADELHDQSRISDSTWATLAERLGTEQLLDVVMAIVRDRALIPVARIETTRDVTVVHGFDDVALAEFCDDTVSAARIDPTDGGSVDEQCWREWELELVDPGSDDAAGLLNRLGNRLLDAGATPAGHGSKLAKVLGDSTPPRASVPTDPVHRAVAEQVELLLVWDRAVRADADDAVHQMRVATRQIRSLLQASEAAFGLTDDASILSELRELAAILGIARDAEVLADRYRKALDALPPELLRGPVRERLVDDARRRYRAGLARSWKAMRSPRYFRLLDALDNLVLTGEPTPGDDHPPADISSSYRKLAKATKLTKAASAADRDDALHRIRKAAKRLRYVAAATGESRVSQRSKTIQTLLGDHQDSVVSRIHLLQQADAAHAAGEDTFTYGVLHREEDELAMRCREQLDDALRELRRTVGRAR